MLPAKAAAGKHCHQEFCLTPRAVCWRRVSPEKGLAFAGQRMQLEHLVSKKESSAAADLYRTLNVEGELCRQAKGQTGN